MVLVQLLKTTTGWWELVVLEDGSTDASLEVVRGVLARYPTWPQCNRTAARTRTRIWRSGAPDRGRFGDRPKMLVQGELGEECLLGPWTLVRVRVLRTPLTGVLPTVGNNLQLRMTAGVPWGILFDDDQIMTWRGWNAALAFPARVWPDVMESARAHSYHVSKQVQKTIQNI